MVPHRVRVAQPGALVLQTEDRRLGDTTPGRKPCLRTAQAWQHITLILADHPRRVGPRCHSTHPTPAGKQPRPTLDPPALSRSSHACLTLFSCPRRPSHSAQY